MRYRLGAAHPALGPSPSRELQPSRRARSCWDHLAGSLGARPANYAFAQARAERTTRPREVSITRHGEAELQRHFGLSSRRCEEEQLNAAAPRSGLRRSPAPLVHTGPGSTAGSNPLGQAVLAVLTCGGRRAVTVVIPFPSQRSTQVRRCRSSSRSSHCGGGSIVPFPVADDQQGDRAWVTP